MDTPLPTPRPSPNIRGVVIFGLIISIIFVAGSLIWASQLPLASAAVAPGTVTVDGNVKTVQHLEGGIIESIGVNNGDSVAIGQELIRFNDAQARASWQLINGRYLNLISTEARLEAERDGLTHIVFPEDLTVPENAERFVVIKKAQQAIFDNGRRTRELKENILLEKIEQLGSQIESFRAQVRSADRQISLIGEEVDAVRDMVVKGLERKPRLLNLQREQARLQGQRDENLGRIAEAEQKIGETQLQILNISIEHQDKVVNELREIQSQLDDVKERREAARDVLERSILRSPVDGVVENLAFFTPGGVIGPGEKIMDIVPADDELIVEAQVNPVDIDVVFPGLPTKLNFPAFKQRTTPSLDGEVFYVSAAIEEDQRTGHTYYKARIRIAADQLARLEGQELIQGMPVSAMIVTGENTFLQYLITPVRESLQRAFHQG